MLLFVKAICTDIPPSPLDDMHGLYTEILEVNLFAFAYRLFHEDFSPIYDALHKLERNLHETVNANKLTSIIYVYKSSPSSTLPRDSRINLNCIAWTLWHMRFNRMHRFLTFLTSTPIIHINSNLWSSHSLELSYYWNHMKHIIYEADSEL